MSKYEVGDIWRLKSEIYDTHVLLCELLNPGSYEGAYIVFKGIDMNTGKLVHAHFRDMSMWSKIG